MDRLFSIEELNKIIIDKARDAEWYGISREAATQLADTMRENERLNTWLYNHGYEEVCSKDYLEQWNKESDNG